jgi:glucosylceramidase
VIRVNDGVRYQRVKGVGAAMTDSSAWLIQNHLSPDKRNQLLDDLFTTDGVHLGFTLIPIGGSDFSVGGVPYTYDDMPSGQSDPTLAHFSIGHDQAYILPVLRQMLALAPGTETFAVPWSPPGWMKANDSLDDLQHRGSLLAGAYSTLASYFVKVLQAYAQAGVPIDAVAPENEPRAASAFPAMYFPEPNEAQWIASDLAPALQAAHLNPKVYGNDTSWQLENYALSLAGSSARNALAGVAWHCYGGIPTVMNDLHSASASLDQIVTECAPNLSRYSVPEILIGAVRNWASEVTLWNIATDPAGGPVEPPNSGCRGCHGLVTINESNGSLTFNLDYYQLGQVGSFVQSGAWRIASNTFVRFSRTGSAYGASAGLDDVALHNPDGSRVLVVYNNSGATSRFAVAWRGRSFTYSLPPRATVTFRWNP